MVVWSGNPNKVMKVFEILPVPRYLALAAHRGWSELLCLWQLDRKDPVRPEKMPWHL
jgi:hypothetical protein